jgi:hypothetical protein
MESRPLEIGFELGLPSFTKAMEGKIWVWIGFVFGFDWV